MELGVSGTIDAAAVIAAAGSHGSGLRFMQVLNEDPAFCNVTVSEKGKTMC